MNGEGARVTIKRTVIIGLGGTGTRVLQYIKGEFQKHFRRGLPPAIRLLAFDTAPQRVPQAGAVGPVAPLDVNEFHHVTATGIRRLLETPEMRSWSPPLEKWDLSDILDGAGQRRASGRLALFRQATNIYNILNNTISRVKSIDLGGLMEGWPGFQVADEQRTSVEVYVVCSLAGGTGSGMFLDLGFMLQDILKEESGDRTIGVFLLPGVFMKNLAAVDFVAGNAYAALKELDHWMGQPEEIDVHYPGGLTIPWGGPLRRPYKFVYLLDDVNEAGAVVNNPETMFYFIARGIFLHMTVQSNELAAFWRNLASILQSADPWNGKLPRYMSFGISSLQIPLETHIEQSVDDLLIQRLEELKSEGYNVLPERLDREVQSFLSDHRLDRALLAERLRPEGTLGEIPPPPERPWSNIHEVPAWKERALKSFEEAVRQEINEHSPKFQELRAEAETLLKERIERMVLREEGHLRRALLFLDRLIRYLQGAQAQVQQELEGLQSRIRSVEFPPPESALQGFFPKRKVEKLVNDYQSLIGQLNDLRLQERIHHLVDLFLRGLLSQANRLREELEAFNRHTERTLNVLRNHLNQLRARQGQGMDAFATVLREEDVEIAYSEKHPSIDLETLAQAWRDSPIAYSLEPRDLSFHPRSLFGWRLLSTEELTTWLQDEVRKHYRDLLEQDLDSILNRLWQQGERAGSDVQEKLRNRLQDFLDKARPLWNVEVDPNHHLQYLLLIGLRENPDTPASLLRTLIENGYLKTGGSLQESFRSHHFSTSWERFAIRALRIGLPAPAYALSKMPVYKQEYLKREANPQSRVTHHIHREWMGPDGLPDLFPEEREVPVSEPVA